MGGLWHANEGAHGDQKGAVRGSRGAEVTDGCKLANVNAGNKIQIFCKSNMCS